MERFLSPLAKTGTLICPALANWSRKSAIFNIFGHEKTPWPKPGGLKTVKWIV